MEVGSFCWWNSPEKPTNQLCLIITSEDDESFALCCDADIRLAGHLDVIMSMGETGLPFVITVLTHVARWISNDELSASTGRVSADNLAEIEGARAGYKPKSLITGRLLLCPELEPRWPMIQKRARRFLD
jgi:hypothetical protein